MLCKVLLGKAGLLIVMLLITQAIFAQGSWGRINIPTNLNLNSVYFTDSLYGWVAGDSGTILHTKDGGINWAFQESQTSNNIVYVFFLNRNLGWASSFDFTEPPYGTELLKTTDGGANWTLSSYPEENIFMNCILFLDSLNGWMGGSPHAIVRTSDGGVSWSQAEVDTSTLAFFPVLKISFFNEQYGYASGGMFDIAGVTWRTDNGGEKWYAIDPSEAPADEVHGLHLFDSVTVLGAGGDPDFGYGVGMLRTANGGVNWNYDELSIQGNAYDLDFRNDTEAWAPLGPRRKLIYSLDAGDSWTDINSPDSTAIYDMIFPDTLHGYAVGRNGAFLKYTPPVPVSVESGYPDQLHQIKLHQNSPNPFRTETIISIEIPPVSIKNPGKKTRLKLVVINAVGEKVSELLDQPYEPGNYEVSFKSMDLPAGIYYYQLLAYYPGKAPAVVSTKKMLLLK